MGALPLSTGSGGAGAAVARARRPLLTTPMSSSMIDAAASSTPMHPLLLRESSFRPSLRASAGPREAPGARSSSGRRYPTPRSDDDGGEAARNVSAATTTASSAPPARDLKRRPRLRALVVVEGPSDARAVLRAVDLSPGCRSLGGATWARNKGAMDELVEAAERASTSADEEGGRAAAVVLLLDPDAPGRVARGEISRELCRRIPSSGSSSSSSSSSSSPLALYHAFIPPHKCRAARAVGGKSAGDVGIEHAAPDAVVAALRSARRHRGEEAPPSSSSEFPTAVAPSRPPLFSMRELEEARLATSFDAGSQQQKKKKKSNLLEKEGEGEGESRDTASSSPPSSSSCSSSSSSSSPPQKTSDRRRRFCDALGLGPCTGAQLLRALNEWGLTREDWEVGMKAAEAAAEEDA